jgi:hypothetical protein
MPAALPMHQGAVEFLPVLRQHQARFVQQALAAPQARYLRQRGGARHRRCRAKSGKADENHKAAMMKS